MSALVHKEDKRNHERGFTMAELLIVVAIVAVLVAIAVPVFSAQLKNSRLAVDHAAMRDAYALAQVANNTQEVEIEGRVYTFDELKADLAGASQLSSFYLTEDCSSFVFARTGSAEAPQGAYLFKETGCEESNRYVCDTCLQLKSGGMHHKGWGILLSFDRSDNCIIFPY